MLERYLTTNGFDEYVDVDCVREALGIKEDEDIFLAIKKLKEERDELKGKVDWMKKRANATYGISCGYSGNKAPAFFCNVISYSWELGHMLDSNSIRVELELRPTANYKGTFDPEDLRQYINEYGREKKLGIIESVDYQNAKNARAELAYLYKTILGKERLDRDLSPHEIMKAILDEYKRIRPVLDEYRTLANDNFNKAEGFRKEKREFLDSVCDVLNIAPRMTYEQILTEVKDLTGRFDELEDFRADICEVIGIDADELFGSPQQNDKYILEQVEKLKESAGHDKLFRDSVCDALDTTTAVSDSYLFKNIEKLKLDHREIQEKYSRYCLAVGSLCNIPAEHREDISWIEDAFNHTKKEYLKLQDTADRLARLRSDICTALCLGHEDCDGNIIGRIHMMQDCHDKLCKDYTELRKAIWDAMDRKPETLPDETARLVGEVRMLQSNYAALKWLHDLIQT